MLAGNVVALLSPIVFIPVFSLVFPSAKYDWQSMKDIRRPDDSDLASAAHMDPESIPGELPPSQTAQEEEEEQRKLLRAAKIARTLCVSMAIALLVLWPMPMYGSSYIFSKGFL